MSVERDFLNHFKTVFTSHRVIELDRPETGHKGKTLEKVPVLEVGVYELESRSVGFNRETALVLTRYRFQVHILMRKAAGLDAGWDLSQTLKTLLQNKIISLGTYRVQCEEACAAPPLEIESPSAWVIPWKCDFTLIL